MRGILVLALVSLLAAPAAAMPPLAPVLATGSPMGNGNFAVEWTEPLLGGNGVMGYRVERYVDGVLAETVELGPQSRTFIDDSPESGLIQYIVYWLSVDGISPGSNPVFRGEYPPCQWLAVNWSTDPPTAQVNPLCLIPEV